MSSVEDKVDDLEEGEIEEDALEDISDCSLSEAIVPHKNLEYDSEVELLREEALKSLPENDEITEEELYRLEALKSLLTNIESDEKISSADETRKRKRKHKKKNRRKKTPKLDSNDVSKTENACEESKLLVEAAEDRDTTSQVDNSSSVDFDKENQTDCDMNLVARSWYPKTDFALLNLCANEMLDEAKPQPKKSFGNDDFIIIPRILSSANDIKSTETIPKGKPVNQPLKLNRVEMPVTRAVVPISKLNCPIPSAVHLSRYKKVSKHHIQKYPVTQPANRFSLRNIRKGKYKIVNKSCYSLKKSANSSPPKTGKPNTLLKSVYSLNRVQNQPASKRSQFIIQLDENESDKEDAGVIPGEKPKLKRSPPKMKKELPLSKSPNWSSQTVKRGLLDERVAELPSVVEKVSNFESFEPSLAEIEIKFSADSPNDEAMPLLEVTSTALTTNCCDTSSAENEYISPTTYSRQMNDETEVSEMIPDGVDERLAVSPGTYSKEKKLFDEAETSEMIPEAVEERLAASSVTYCGEKKLRDGSETSEMIPKAVEERFATSPGIYCREEKLLDGTETSEMIPEAVEERLATSPGIYSGEKELFAEPKSLDLIPDTVDKHVATSRVAYSGEKELFVETESADLIPDIVNEHFATSPVAYSREKELFVETETSDLIPDDVDEHLATSPDAYPGEKELSDEIETSEMIPDKAEYEVTSPSLHSPEMNSPNRTEVSKITPAVDNCDIGFLPHSHSVASNEQLTEEPALLNFVACSPEQYDRPFAIKEEPLDAESVEDLSMEENMECDATCDAETDERENLMVLQDAEADLIEIRAKLLWNLGELEENLRKDESEREKLNTMLRKLLVLKSSIFKFENVIRAHQSKLSIHADTMQALFKDIADRTNSCAQMKNVCFRVGMEIMGPQYKPPDVYENVIEEKIRAIDFSKFMPSFK